MTNTDKERADFEAWASNGFELHRHGAAEYSSTHTQSAWAAWQSRAGREAERAETVTDAEPIAWGSINVATNKLCSLSLERCDLREVAAWKVIPLYTHQPKTEPSPDVKTMRGEIALALTKRLVIDIPTARAAVDEAFTTLTKPEGK